MNLRNVSRKFGMSLAAGAVVLTATPAASAATAPTPVPAVSRFKTLADYAKQRDAAREAARASGSTLRPSCAEGIMRSKGNDLMVSAELAYQEPTLGMLRARSSTDGPWERFRICYDGTSDTIYSVGAQRYVSAEVATPGEKNGMLRAHATLINAWERFRLQCGSVYCSIRSLANDRLVSAELQYTGADYGMLRARSTTTGDWELFW
ncbi:hypothetical protein Pth03_82330 [Planotetraspora thailandica]|uniref:Tat pathway signal sequence domain protein n=1 Tax=Planotetraspora thailandica TaxID=487172 RepID=A0A8J3Y2Z3_9ACTN|nr:hypothetical protein [Planotetraspora thailandica]GII59844.1 hypothetical protein Pth03_82330 [Planotetraspora thailandica]